MDRSPRLLSANPHSAAMLARARTHSRVMAHWIGSVLAIAVFSLIVVPASAQTSPIRLRIVKDKTLSRDLVYWFVAPSLPPSAKRPLPQAGPDGAVTVELPPLYTQPGAQAKVLDPRKGLLAHLPIMDSAGRFVTRLHSPNLLQNPDFARDGEHWLPELNGGQAKGQLEWLGGAELPKGVTGKAVRIKVLAMDTVPWHVQLHQPGLDLASGEPYTLTFWGRADRARPLSVNATVDKEDYHWVGLSNQVGLTTEWRKVVLVFTATRTVQDHTRLGFVVGDYLGTVDLASITLQRGVAAGPLGPNLLQNSDFAHGTAPWLSSAVAPARAATKAPSDVPAPPNVRGKVAQVEVEETGTQNWHVQFFQTGIDLTEDEPLTLSFWAKSSRARSVNIIAGEDKEDFHTVGLDNYAGLEPAWRKFTFVFTATRTVRNSHRLTFLMGDSAGEVDLANIALQPGAEGAVEPGGGLEVGLSAADFKYSHSVNVPVRYRGKQVQDLAVTLKYHEESMAPYTIQPADRGSAHFTDVPIDEKITVLVSNTTQTAEFPRIVASDSPNSVGEIEVPENWTQVAVNPNEAANQYPLVGRWLSQTDDHSQRFVTTFNADGTGTIKRASDDSTSEGPGRTLASSAFLWHVKGPEHRIVMSSREYTWSVGGKGQNEKLVLRDASGRTHIFYRR